MRPEYIKYTSSLYNILTCQTLLSKEGNRLRNRFYTLILFVFESVVNKFSSC